MPFNLAGPRLCLYVVVSNTCAQPSSAVSPTFATILPNAPQAPDLSEIQSACAKPEEMSAAPFVTARHGSLEHDSAQLQAHGSDQHQPEHNQLRTPLGNAAGRENQGPPVATSTPKSTKMKEILSNHLTCPICCEWLLACHTLSCGHMFCGLCLATWLSQSSSCPSCRKPVAGRMMTTNYTHLHCVS